ncbi:YihY/virulence factor BrkB family protein [Georgenia sp. Z1491]|uniref:YihY/virulence factor BrkB family protein n=1 Tax=Georgenia sp. Z1491 TaxID=3416707 RepID=UPI003CFBA87A
MRTGAGAHRVPEPADGTPSTWWYVARRTVAEFIDDQLIDRAAALTFFAVLSVFPALVALVSVLGIFGQGVTTTNAILTMLEEPLPAELVAQLRGPVASITENQGAGLGLVVGILVSMWTASNYVYAFSRAMNIVYGMEEGRPLWKHRPAMYVLTIVLVVLVGVAALLLVVSGPVARWIGDLVGLGSTAVMVWNVVRWPVLLLVVIVVIALLYYLTPNARLARMGWMSPGAALAILVAGIATVGFGSYVTSFGRFNATYGALAGVIIFLLWLWVMNLVILLGAVLDSEIARVRQLRRGVVAEVALQLPLRDDTKLRKVHARRERLVAEGRRLRLAHSGRTEEAHPPAAVSDRAGEQAHLPATAADRPGELSDRAGGQSGGAGGPVVGGEQVLDRAPEDPREPEGER